MRSAGAHDDSCSSRAGAHCRQPRPACITSFRELIRHATTDHCSKTCCGEGVHAGAHPASTSPRARRRPRAAPAARLPVPGSPAAAAAAAAAPTAAARARPPARPGPPAARPAGARTAAPRPAPPPAARRRSVYLETAVAFSGARAADSPKLAPQCAACASDTTAAVWTCRSAGRAERGAARGAGAARTRPCFLGTLLAWC